MSLWLAAAAALMVVGLAPALFVGARGEPLDRLVGLELASVVAVLVLLALSEAVQQSSYLIVPLVLALLSFAGTLVFTRLLGPRA